MVERLEMQTKDLSQEKIRMIGELFPNCITESKEGEKTVLSVDFDALRQELSGDIVEGSQERYQFTWPDKIKYKRLANAPTTMTLRPCREASLNFDNANNIYIEGDNVKVLKVLRETYLGKIKVIYIDPPYNTGKDWISYDDDYSMSNSEYEKIDGSFDEENNRLRENTRSNGRFHTNWLNSIYPVLMLSKNMLRDDGLIFVSIDEREYPNLRKIMDDDIYGESNYIGDLVWESVTQPVNAGDAKYSLQKKTEMILIYAKDKNKVSRFTLRNLGISYNYPDDGKHGKCRFEIIEKSDSGSYNRESMKFKILGQDPLPGKRWQIGEQLARQLEKEGKIEIVNGRVKRAIYPEDEVNKESLEPFWSLLRSSEVGTAQSGKKELNDLFGFSVGFDTVKPVTLIKRILEYVGNEGIVLDFYSGSGTTGQAVMEINSELNCDYRYILVQYPEELSVPSFKDAIEHGYKTMCDLGIARLKLSNNRIKSIGKADGSFRVFRCDTSNMRNTFYSPDQVSHSSLEDYTEIIKSDRTFEDLLFQVMLELGVELSAPIKRMEIRNYSVFSVDDGYLCACFDDSIDDSTVIEISKKMSGCMYAIFRSGSSMTDEMLANIEQIFKTYSPQTKIRIL
ncbi:MAG: site-specific DNA-methyltransferase [Candidatus Methanomethylophilaceae archaeon]|nr:site-specific DNA-methyltransferase [Candidatus Methanomethylophilaceae archaeon]